jgi:ABC-2 type transport system permease protein
MIINHVDLMVTILWLPLILAEVYIFALGVSLFLSAAFVKYRDINYIWEVILQAGFYMTPILYPLSRITNLTLQKMLLLNPMAQTIQDARYVSISHQTTTIYKIFEGGWYSLTPFIIVVFTLFIGTTYFRSQSKYFAENI